MMTKDYYWTGAQNNIGILSKSWNDRNSFMHLSLFERQVRPLFNKLSYSCDDWKLFYELKGTR